MVLKFLNNYCIIAHLSKSDGTSQHESQTSPVCGGAPTSYPPGPGAKLKEDDVGWKKTRLPTGWGDVSLSQHLVLPQPTSRHFLWTPTDSVQPSEVGLRGAVEWPNRSISATHYTQGRTPLQPSAE